MNPLLENTHWEPLCGGARVLVSPEHGFGTDAVLLAHFAAPRPGERWADLGTGCGVIPLLWRVRTQAGSITGVELQEKAAQQAERSVAENGFSQSVSILRGDARRLSDLFPAGSLDGIACNPPYTPPGAGIPCGDAAGAPPARGTPFPWRTWPGGPAMPCALGAGCACACGPSGWGRRWGFSNAFSWSPSGCGCASSGRAKRPFSFCWSAAGAAGPAWTWGPCSF